MLAGSCGAGPDGAWLDPGRECVLAAVLLRPWSPRASRGLSRSAARGPGGTELGGRDPGRLRWQVSAARSLWGPFVGRAVADAPWAVQSFLGSPLVSGLTLPWGPLDERVLYQEFPLRRVLFGAPFGRDLCTLGKSLPRAPGKPVWDPFEESSVWDLFVQRRAFSVSFCCPVTPRAANIFSFPKPLLPRFLHFFLF